jgi:hypothetical protein
MYVCPVRFRTLYAVSGIENSFLLDLNVFIDFTKYVVFEPWFDEGCVGFLDQRKQARMQWIQDPSLRNVDNLNNVRRDAGRHFRNKRKAYLKAKIEELETNSTIKNVRDLYRGH